MNKDIKYCKDIKSEFINKLHKYFKYFKIDNKKYFLDLVTNQSKSFLNESYIDLYEEYINISNIN